MSHALARPAAVLYAGRKSRALHPEGDFDNAGRFYPSDVEDSDDYTSHLRSPSRSWPYSYMVGARTRKHIIALCLASPEFVVAEAAKAGVTATVSPSQVGSMGRAIEKLQRQRAEEAEIRAHRIRVQQAHDETAKRIREEVEVQAQHVEDMTRDGEFLSNLG